VDSRDEEIYRRHADELIRFATTLVVAGSAEDVLSRAILKAMTSHSWQTVTEHRAYLFRAVPVNMYGTVRSRHIAQLRRVPGSVGHSCQASER
jgi:DNA-directed RNA polymerase specialized sigma24 family protein